MSTFLTDTFTSGATGAAITLGTRAVEVGGPWSRHASYGADYILSDAGRARPNGTALNYAAGLPSGVEYDVSFVIRCFTIVTNNFVGASARVATGADTFYSARYNTTALQWEIVSRIAGGTVTVLGSAAATLTPGNDYSAVFKVRDAKKSLEIAGVEVCSTTDNTITAAGRVGVRGTTATSNTTGLHLDSISAADAGASPQRGTLLWTGSELVFKPVKLFKGGVLV